MRHPSRKVTIDIHGVRIKTQQKRYGEQWSSTITIPRPTLRKLVELGPELVRVRCTGIYTDDYAYDSAANFQKGDVPLDCELFTRPDYNILDHRSTSVYLGSDGLVHFSRGQWEGYTLQPLGTVIDITVRD